MEEITVTFNSYSEYKTQLDAELQKTAEGFVRIGYLLKVARDTNILAESGYKSVAEFAAAEYNLDKTQVSRFISINDRFSEGGYSDHLLPEYKGYGYSKLTIMLQIPGEITEELSANYSKADIQAIKEEVDEEKKISDLEVAMEPPKVELEELNLLEKVMFLLLEEDTKLYARIWKKYYEDGLNEYKIRELLAPSGEKSYSVRIPGSGREMMILDDTKEEITITNIRTYEKVTYTWLDVMEAAILMTDRDSDTMEESWQNVFGRQFPEEKREVAPVQQNKETKKPEPKKESKVQKAKKPEKPIKTSTEPTPEPAPEPIEAEEEQLPGQMRVEDFPEIMPESSFEEIKEEKDAEPGEPEGTGDTADSGKSEPDPAMAGGEIREDNAGAGGEESSGSTGSPERNRKSLEAVKWAWMDLREAWPPSINYITDYDDMAPELYRKTIDLAAALEKYMIERAKE